MSVNQRTSNATSFTYFLSSLGEKDVDETLLNEMEDDDDEETWLECDDETEGSNQDARCLFCEAMLPSPEDVLFNHCPKIHDFDIRINRRKYGRLFGFLFLLFKDTGHYW